MIVYEASLLFCKKFLKMKKKFDYANTNTVYSLFMPVVFRNLGKRAVLAAVVAPCFNFLNQALTKEDYHGRSDVSKWKCISITS